MKHNEAYAAAHLRQDGQPGHGCGVSSDQPDDILDDLFHACALSAWLHQAAEQLGWPDSEATRERAYRYFEEALAEKNRRKP